MEEENCRYGLNRESFQDLDKFPIIAVIALQKTSLVFNNKGRAVADPASDLHADAIAAG